MPKQVFKLPGFGQGIIGNASPRDIPEDGMSYGENVDSRVRGRIEGIKGNDTVSSSYDARVMGAVLGDDKNLIGQDASGQFKRYDIGADGVEDIGSSVSTFARSVIPTNKEVICSMTKTFRGDEPADPKWVGRISDVQFLNQNNVSGNAPEITSSVSDTDTTVEVDDASPLSVGNHVIIRDPTVLDPDYEVMKVTGISSNTLTVERGLLWTEAKSYTYDSGFPKEVITIVAPGTEYEVEDVKLESHDDADLIEISNFSDTGTDGIFDSSKRYYYAVTFIYDGYQESPLNTGWDYSPSNDANVIRFDLFFQFDDPSSFSRRITGINIYRAESASGGSSATSNYSLFMNIPLNTHPETGTETFDKVSSTSYDYRYKAATIGDTGSTGATYEDNTGNPETLESTHIKYTIATPYGGYLFVGGAKKDGIPDAEKYIFRSQPKTYSIIDWSNDFTILPERPVALSGFNGRVYAFSRTSMYRINPLTLDVEDSYAGVGALNENMVVSTNYGMFHADNNNIYHNTGTVSKPIGDPILTMQDEPGLGWQELNKTTAGNEHYASMAFDPINKRLLLFVESSGSDTICWAYDVTRQRWDLYTDFDIPSTTAIGPDGVLYATTGNTTAGFELVSLFTSSSRKNWKVRSKDFDLDSDSGDFWAYDLQGYGEGSFNIKYAKDGGSLTDQGTTTEDGLRKTTVSSADKKMKSIQVQAESTSSTDSLDNLTVQFRPQVINE